MFSPTTRVSHFWATISQVFRRRRNMLLEQLQFVRVVVKSFLGLLIAGSRGLDRSGPIVALTTFPARVNGIWLPVGSILFQSERPSRIVVVVTGADFKTPREFRALRFVARFGVEIVTHSNHPKGYKKLLPILETSGFVDKPIITIDDDVAYTRHLIRDLMDWHQRFPQNVLCTLGRRILYTDNGSVAPYLDWPRVEAGTHGADVVPIGMGAILYPNVVINSWSQDQWNLASRVAPNVDDLGFWALSHVQGWETRVIASNPSIPLRKPPWNTNRLWPENRDGRNLAELERLSDALRLNFQFD